MNIFHKRPLGLILCIGLCGFSFFAILDPLLKGILLFLSLCFIAILFIVPSLRQIKLTFIIALTLIISFSLSFLYFEIVMCPFEFSDEESVITGEILDFKDNSDILKTLDVKVTSVNGSSLKTKIKLYLYSHEDEIHIGDTIKFQSVIEEFSSDGSFDFKKYYSSKGFTAMADTSAIEIVEVGEPSLLYKFKLIRESICDRAVMLAGEESGGLLAALLLGERDRISGSLTLDFQRIGLTHILSLSGMHFAILSGGLDKLLYAVKLSKKWRMSIGILFSALFMALTGFPITVCRAGIMIILSSVIYLISGSKDSITSLFVATSLIILVTPYAAMDIGLWLSVIATVGILVASEYFKENEKYKTGFKKYLYSLFLMLAFSLFAVCATSAISAITFSSFSVISIISTFVFSFLIEAFVYLGIIVLVLGNVIPLASVLSLLNSAIVTLAENISDISLVYASSSYTPVVMISFLISLSLLAFSVLKIERKRSFLAFILIVYFANGVLALAMTAKDAMKDEIVWVNEGYDACLIYEDDEVLLFDSSAHNKSIGYGIKDLLADENVVELDTYYIANYSSRLPECIDIVLSGVLTREILIPYPRNEYEESILLEAASVLNDYRTVVTLYKDMEIYTFGEFKIYVPFRSKDENSFVAVFATDEKMYSYLSRGALEYCYRASSILFVSDTIIFGGYGSAYSDSFALVDIGERVKRLILFDESFEGNFDDSKFSDIKIINKKTNRFKK